VTLSLSRHHARIVAFNSSLKNERSKEWKNNGLGKIASQMKVPHNLYKGTRE
jgi:phage protein D